MKSEGDNGVEGGLLFFCHSVISMVLKRVTCVLKYLTSIIHQ